MTPSAQATPSAQPGSSAQATPSAPASPVRAEQKETSPPLTTAAGVILLGLPEGNTGGEQLDQDVHMDDSSTPTEGVLHASNIGAEPTHDKSSAVPEQTTDQQPESQPRQHQV